MESHAPQYQPSQESLIPTTEYAPPETPKLRSPSPAESAAALAMSKLASPDHVKFISPAPRTTSSMTPPPSSQIPGTRAVMRTPTPSTPQLTSPPPTSKLPDQPSALTDMGAGLYPQDQVNAASAEELRSMVNSLSNALRDMRLSAAHYKLQYNMAVMESQEAASRMAVELAMAQRELDVLQQAEEKRKSTISAPEQNYQESAHAANAMMLSEMSRQNQILQSENEELRDVLEQQKRLTEHREGELASVLDENDRLKTRIRKNRDHIAPLLEQIEHSSPRSNFGTPIQPPPRSRIGRLPAPLSQESRSQNNFEALLLADKMLSQEVATAPSTPNRIHAPKSRFGHQRGAQSLSSIPQPPNRRVAYPRAQVPRTPPSYVPTSIPQSAPPAHYQYQQKPSNIRRQSSNSTITASSMDDEEAFTDREEDEVPESQASQMARNLLQRPPPAKGMMSAPAPQSNLIQSKIFGQVKKGHGLGRPGELKRGRVPSTADLATSPPKRGRVDQGVGLGIGGLLRE